MVRRGYPPETRARALELLRSGRSAFFVAQEVGVSLSLVYRWRAQAALEASERSEGSEDRE